MSEESFHVIHSTGWLISSKETLFMVKVLGRGSQGTAYHVKRAENGEYALKLYHTATVDKDKTIHARVKRLVKIGAPSQSFCWALDYLEVVYKESTFFGYIMKLRDPEYIAPAKFMNGDCQMDFKPLFLACLNLADSFAQLHLRGLCYKDVSINNFFFHPETGKCCIIDIDNICYDSVKDYSANVLGTPRFMAPEIVDGSAKPSIYTDYHSLAVLLFYLLLLGHPLEGLQEKNIKIFDIAAQKRLYGSSATYIFDLNNPSNRPDPEIHSPTIFMSNILPDHIMKTFDLAFSRGLHDPNHRVPDSKWSLELKRLIDLMTHCPSCGQENFLSPSSPEKTICWECKVDFSPLLIQSNKCEYIASPGVIVESDGDLVATVIRHPKDQTILGLRNESVHTWQATLPEDKTSEIPPWKSIILGTGIVLDTQNPNANILKII